MPRMIGSENPNWKGGKLAKACAVCDSPFFVSVGRREAKYCSMQCVGVSQRGQGKRRQRALHKVCICGKTFIVCRSVGAKQHSCSRACSFRRRSVMSSGKNNANWHGGLSRLPYPFDFTRVTSKQIIARDDRKCRSPHCRGKDQRLTAHHIDYDKNNCAPRNLITLCSSCNSRANFDRPQWQAFYEKIMAKRGGGWLVEEF